MIYLLLLLAISVVCAPVALGAEAIDPERVNQIAAMLPERPTGFGAPIGDRASWAAIAEDPDFGDAVGRAERLLETPLPEMTDEAYLDYSRTGNRTRWQRVAGRRRGRVGTLVLAECLEAKGRFVPAFEELVRALCSERTWVMPAHDRNLDNFHGRTITIDLRSSSLGCELATADYLLGARLSPEVRRLLRETVRERVLDPYLAMVRGERSRQWWLETTNNWNAVCLAGVTGAALALVESRRERAFFIAAAEHYSRRFLDGFTDGGYCTEGLGYWNYGFGHYVLLAESIHRATGGGVDLLGRPKARPPASFGARIEITRGVYPAFADCGVGTSPSTRILWFVSRRLGLGLGEYEEADVSSPDGGLAAALMYSFPNSASRAGSSERDGGIGQRTWFEQAGVLVCRPDTGTDGAFGVALKGGHNDEHHNHNDVGSFFVALNGQEVLLDPGSEVYTARTFSSRRYESDVLNSYGHPVPVVAGELQSTGREARAGVLDTQFGQAGDTLSLDLSAAYEVPELERLERTFEYSRQGAGALTVTDEVAFSSPQSFGTALITLGRWERLGPNALKVFDTQGAVRVEVRAQGAGFTVSSEEIDEDVRARSKPVRIGIDLDRPVARGGIRLTITPLSGPEHPKLANGGFEAGEWGWRIPPDGMASITTEHAASGGASLRVRDESEASGSDVASARVPASDGQEYELRGKVLPISGTGLGVYMRYLDAKGEPVNPAGERGGMDALLSLGGAEGEWKPFSKRFKPPQGTRYLQVWIHSYNAARVDACLDDLEIIPVD